MDPKHIAQLDRLDAKETRQIQEIKGLKEWRKRAKRFRPFHHTKITLFGAELENNVGRINARIAKEMRGLMKTGQHLAELMERIRRRRDSLMMQKSNCKPRRKRKYHDLHRQARGSSSLPDDVDDEAEDGESTMFTSNNSEGHSENLKTDRELQEPVISSIEETPPVSAEVIHRDTPLPLEASDQLPVKKRRSSLPHQQKSFDSQHSTPPAPKRSRHLSPSQLHTSWFAKRQENEGTIPSMDMTDMGVNEDVMTGSVERDGMESSSCDVNKKARTSESKLQRSRGSAPRHDL